MENLEFFQTNNGNVQFSTENGLSDAKNGEHFIIDDLLNFPNDDIMVVADGGLEAAFTGTSTATPVDTSSSFSATAEPYFQGGPRVFADAPFSNDLCVPYDDLGDISDMEWLSNIVDDSFPSEDSPQIDGLMKVRTKEASQTTHQYQFQAESACQGRPVPAKARSKRSRAAPGNWTSRLLVVSPTPTSESSSESDTKKTLAKKKEEVPGGGEGRKCLHCATDKTPQWRTGPLGPKTLCNACGVRYKSGRLVPEYRPASSPTFVLTKHSNSHRKVLELRRQKEMVRTHQQQHFLNHHQNMMFDVSNADDYLIHQHIGPDYRQLI